MNHTFKNRRNGRVVYFLGLCTIESYIEKTESDGIFNVEVLSEEYEAISYEDKETHNTFVMPLLAFLNTYEPYNPADDIISVAKKYGQPENLKEDGWEDNAHVEKIERIKDEAPS